MNSILLMQAFLSLGNALTGFFFPFLLKDKFTLSFEEILFTLGGIYGLVSVFIFFIHKNIPVSIQQKLASGILFLVLTLLLLLFGNTSLPIFLLIISNYVLQISLLSPSFHWINIQQICQSTRGTFLGNMQVLQMGSLIIGPLFSGFLIDHGFQNSILILSILLYSIAFIFAIRIPIPIQKNPQLPSLKKSYTFFSTHILQKSFFHMSLIEGVQTASLILIYPLLLKIVLQQYTLMGEMFFLMATIEIISAKTVGFLTDKYSSEKMIHWGALARFLDIAPRGLLVLFPSTILATLLAISAGILGPLFGISFYSQIYKHAEKSKESYTFLITREWIVGFVRCIFFILTALSFHFIGIYALTVALFLAGTISFFLKRME